MGSRSKLSKQGRAIDGEQISRKFGRVDVAIARRRARRGRNDLGYGRAMRGREKQRSLNAIEWVRVSREDLDTTLLAGGDLQPAKQTVIDCEVEDITESDGTIVLSVIPNGSHVKKGDELCRLDSAAIEELARQQEISVGQARGALYEGKSGTRMAECLCGNIGTE